MFCDSFVDLTNPQELKSFVAKHGLHAKKSLGQHWLISKAVVDKIIGAALPAASFVEIGPGPGVLTQHLVRHARTFAIDVDARVGAGLLESAPEATFIHEDILQTDLVSLCEGVARPCVMVSNLPYQVSTAILSKMVEWRDLFSRFVFMMQKEVAERVTAGVGNSDRGSLSVALQSRFVIKKVCDVSRGCFLPPPKVESRVLLFVSDDAMLAVPDHFDEIVRLGFKQPRKTVLNNLRSSVSMNVEDVFKKMGLHENVRPHELTLDDWLELANQLRYARN